MGKEMTVEALIDVFDDQVRRLVGEGVPVDRIADAMKVSTLRAEMLHGTGSMRKLNAIAERLRGTSERATFAEEDEPVEGSRFTG